MSSYSSGYSQQQNNPTDRFRFSNKSGSISLNDASIQLIFFFVCLVIVIIIVIVFNNKYKVECKTSTKGGSGTS